MRIQIEKLAFGGAGVGRIEGKVVFVRGGLPGEVLKVTVIREKGRYSQAEIDDIVVPAPERTKPLCPFFEKCGGCQWQHLDYLAQLKAKELILRETLERIGGLKHMEIEPLVPSLNQYGYRNRVTLSAWYQKGICNIGYNEEGSRKKIRIDACPIALKPIEKAISRLSRSLSSMNAPFPLEKIHIASDEKSAYITLVPPLGGGRGRLNSLRDHLMKFVETDQVGIWGDTEAEFEFSLLGLKFYSAASIFTQET